MKNDGMSIGLGLWAAFLLFVCVGGVEAAEIHVCAAASLTDALKEIGAGFEKSTGDKVLFNFGASNMLARQIEEGAPADLFLSADEARMDGLQKKGLLREGSRVSLLSNSLVVIVPSDSGITFSSFKDIAGPAIHRLALADPSGVPAGVYAKQYLRKTRLWDSVAGRVVPTDNVRAALSAVEYGNADAAIVYKTDAAISHKVRTAWEVPREEGPRISYPAAVLKGASSSTEALKFLSCLSGKQSAEIFRKFGFFVLSPKGK